MSRSPIDLLKIASDLVEWYREHKRELPWRTGRDPYPIWLSEVMLQQTTVAAVIPHFHRFLKQFPDLQSLARASEVDVVANWAGLGYYSRARNLHRAAVALVQAGGFPRTHQELLEFPGFGPYTARAVASLAFGDRCGVIDGNVIRVLSRLLDLDVEWWTPRGREAMQATVDRLVEASPKIDISDLNQGLMELGATVCTPRSPVCLHCPVRLSCAAQKHGTIDRRPKSRPRRTTEIWHWTVEVFQKPPAQAARQRPRGQEPGGRKGLLKSQQFKGQKKSQLNGPTEDTRVWLTDTDTDRPFLRSQWTPPGVAVRLAKTPKTFQIRGSVTHHDIYVSIIARSSPPKPQSAGRWVGLDELSRWSPSSLVRKVILAGLSEPRGGKPSVRSALKSLVITGLLASLLGCQGVGAGKKGAREESAPTPAGIAAIGPGRQQSDSAERISSKGEASNSSGPSSSSPSTLPLLIPEWAAPRDPVRIGSSGAYATNSFDLIAQPVTERGPFRGYDLDSTGGLLAVATGGRSAHDTHQLYLVDLERRTERRLTYQSGEISEPRFASGLEIFFLSDTKARNNLDRAVADLRSSSSEETKGAAPFAFQMLALDLRTQSIRPLDPQMRESALLALPLDRSSWAALTSAPNGSSEPIWLLRTRSGSSSVKSGPWGVSFSRDLHTLVVVAGESSAKRLTLQPLSSGNQTVNRLSAGQRRNLVASLRATLNERKWPSEQAPILIFRQVAADKPETRPEFWLLLSRDGDIWIETIDGRCSRPLTQTPQRQELEPRISQDLRRVTFLSIENAPGGNQRAPGEMSVGQVFRIDLERDDIWSCPSRPSS